MLFCNDILEFICIVSVHLRCDPFYAFYVHSANIVYKKKESYLPWFVLFFNLLSSAAEIGRYIAMLRNPSSVLRACAAFALLQVMHDDCIIL